jgi:hypothetical protein
VQGSNPRKSTDSSRFPGIRCTGWRFALQMFLFFFGHKSNFADVSLHVTLQSSKSGRLSKSLEPSALSKFGNGNTVLDNQIKPGDWATSAADMLTTRALRRTHTKTAKPIAQLCDLVAASTDFDLSRIHVQVLDRSISLQGCGSVRSGWRGVGVSDYEVSLGQGGAVPRCRSREKQP